MPLFTPPATMDHSDDPFFGRYGISVGESVVKVNGAFVLQPYPWLGDIADLTEGTDWFQGGRTYTVTQGVAADLTDAGFAVDHSDEVGYGVGPYGEIGYGL